MMLLKRYWYLLIFLMMPYALFGAGGDEEVECTEFSYFETDSELTDGTIDTIIVHFSIPEALISFPELVVTSHGDLDTAYFSNYLLDQRYLIISADNPTLNEPRETEVILAIDPTNCDNILTIPITIVPNYPPDADAGENQIIPITHNHDPDENMETVNSHMLLSLAGNLYIFTQIRHQKRSGITFTWPKQADI